MLTYLVTGVTGYIGSMLTKHLLSQGDVRIIAPVRQEMSTNNLCGCLHGLRRYIGFACRKHTSYFPTVPEPYKNGAVDVSLSSEHIKVIRADLCDSTFLNQIYAQFSHIDYIIHCASVTKSSEMVSHPAETARSIVNATQNILELSRHYDIKSMVYLSSMEVYGDIDCSDGHRVKEEEADSGKIKLLCTRSCYPLGKRMAENICYGYFKEYGIPVKIARLSQTFGHGILPSENRIFAQFARSVINGTDIILHTHGQSMGNYCAIDDAVDGILTILEHGQNGEAYNVVNEKNTMTIRQMAELVASQVAQGRIGVCYDIPQGNRYGYAADTGLRLSGEKLRELGWRPKKSLVDMYRDMLEELGKSK